MDSRIPTNEELEQILSNLTLDEQVKLVRDLHEENAGLKEVNLKLEEVSLVDPLTGAYNLRALERTLQAIDGRRQNPSAEYENGRTEARRVQDYTILALDLDNFKTINDLPTDQAGGDVVLQEYVRILWDVFRKEEVYRRGGDEFAVVSQHIPIELVDQRRQELVERTEEYGIFAYDSERNILIPAREIEGGIDRLKANIAVTASIGVETPSHGVSAREQLAQASRLCKDEKDAKRKALPDRGKYDLRQTTMG